MRAWVLAASLFGTAAAAQPPAIVGVTPSTLQAGSGDMILRVRGDGFTSSTVVRWDGSERVTAVIAPDTLTTMILSSDLVRPGEARLTAFDPASGLSKVFVVQVKRAGAAGSASARAPNPVPAIAGFEPDHVRAGRGRLTVRVRGSGFTPFSAVRWSGAPRATRYVSSTTLEARLLPEDLAYAGESAVTVRNPLPGGGVSKPMHFTIDATDREALDHPRVHPNPWRADEHDGENITFEHLAVKSVIRIFTVNGACIKTIPASDGLGEWDLTNQSGKPVDGGAYVYLITDGKKTVEGKVRVWR